MNVEIFNGRPFHILCGDALATLRTLPASSIHCCVTSPPYWGLRDYGADGQIGLERTPEEYVAKLVEVFREVRRVLRDDGTLWLNLGDSYATRWGSRRDRSALGQGDDDRERSGAVPAGLKEKDLVGIPWMVAFALRADGWYLRSDVIWAKPNPMPESVTDRPTKAHEYLFLLSKAERYFYDLDAIREPHEMRPQARPNGHKRRRPGLLLPEHTFSGTVRDEPGIDGNPAGRNKRTVWTVTTKPFAEAHFATMPPDLVEPCIKAGTSERGACANCGAPWLRVTGEKILVDGPRAGNKERRIADGSDGDRPADHLGRGIPWAPSVTPTIDWRPSCNCPNGGGNPAPAVVLDPFNGAGTTGLVATRLQRRYVGIELNPEYVVMSERRIVGDAPLFNSGAA